MPQITIGDVTGSAQLDVAGASLLAQHQLSQLKTAASNFVALFSKPVSDPAFQDAKFAASFNSPSIPLGNNTVCVKASVNSILAVSRASDAPLFGKDDYDPVDVAGNDCWVSFELDTLISANAAVPLPDGFGVGFTASSAPSFTTHMLIPGGQASLKDAIEQTLDAFDIPNSADKVFGIPQGRIYSTQISGTVAVTGSWALPLSVNQLSLADAKLPFNSTVAVNPALTVSLSGSIALTGGYTVRFRRVQADRLRVGLYKTKGVDFSASFTASAGLEANLGTRDLIAKVFTALDSKIDLSSLSADDSAKIKQVLNDSIDRSLSLSLNAACSAADTDEAAVLYEIDVSAPNQATKDAIDRALHGDWTKLADLTNAQKIRNVIRDTAEKTSSIAVNLLGLYNYRSVADFVASMKVLKNLDDGSITITDTATAARIAVASTPLAADPDKLRAALYEGFVATATYKALEAGVGVSSYFSAAQDYLLYRDSMGYRQALKQLNAGEVLGVMQAGVKTALPAEGVAVRHARFAASCKYANDGVLHFFFSDAQQLMPRTASDLKKIGRDVLASLLDPQDSTDQKRIAMLQSDPAWADLDKHPAQVPPPYYSDWMDIGAWANTIAKVGPLLTDAIQFGRTVQGDPSANADFMKKRAAVALALDDATHNTHAAFEKAFPICVMARLAGAQVSPVFEAAWNSKTIFSNAPAAVTKGGHG